ncbi:hypothetical protein ACODT3_38300 [Streptomyces sp. 4.24]|uniref:hypothetical protein n=1 Tax=Streptomyces tritrimontium TaxID=3406573 RepID=UPI003BB6636C
MPFDALLVIDDAGEAQERILHGVAVVPARLDALPNGRIVVGGRSPVGNRNTQIFGRDGRPRRGFATGEHTAFLMADRRNNLWTAYTDEGIYGDPLSAAGLARWDSGGNRLWEYWPPAGVSHIADIGALNVTDSTAWAVYWPHSPLVETRASGQLRVRDQPVTSPRGLAVHGDRVVMLGGRRGGFHHPDGLHYCRLTDAGAVLVEDGEAVLTMPGGDPLRSPARPVGRGRNLYVRGRSAKQWYVLGL